MKSRSDSVAIYRDKNRSYCRLCTSNVAYNLSARHHICRMSSPHICCSYGSDILNRWTQNFHFDNTKHTIVLSTNFCSLCKESRGNCFNSCKFGVTELMHDFAKEMKKVEER